MKQQFKDFQVWMNERQPRERMLLLVLTCAITYLLWTLIIIRPIKNDIKQLTAEIKLIKDKINIVEAQIKTISDIISSSVFSKKFSEYKQLLTQSQALIKRLTSVEFSSLSEQKMSAIIKDVLNQQNNIILTNFKTLPPENWLSKIPNASSFPTFFQSIDKHNFQMVFTSNYFDALHYLAQLEKMPWHLLWDHLDYKVKNYPNAEITIQFHILSSEKKE